MSKKRRSTRSVTIKDNYHTLKYWLNHILRVASNEYSVGENEDLEFCHEVVGLIHAVVNNDFANLRCGGPTWKILESHDPKRNDPIWFFVLGTTCEGTLPNTTVQFRYNLLKKWVDILGFRMFTVSEDVFTTSLAYSIYHLVVVILNDEIYDISRDSELAKIVLAEDSGRKSTIWGFLTLNKYEI